MKEKNPPPHRQAQKVDLAKVTEYLIDQDFTVVSIRQGWRHVQAHLQKAGKDFSFKMASSTGIGPRTKNEVAWLKALEPSSDGLLNVPKIYQTGSWQGLFYFLAEFIDGSPLSDENSTELSRFFQFIDQVAEICMSITRLTLSDLPRDRDPNDTLSQPQAIANRLEKWSDELELLDLKPLVELAKPLTTKFIPAPCHGDFVPRHMLQQQVKIWLIDCEAGSARAPKFYDCAYCFHRLYTKFGQPEIAFQFLDLILQKLSPGEREEFYRQFIPVLALRTIGGYRDHHLEDGTKIELHHQLQAAITSSQFLPKI